MVEPSGRAAALTRRSRSGLGLGAIRLAGVPFGIVTQVSIARAAGSNAYGEFAVMISVAGVLATVMAAGIPTFAARLLPRLAPAAQLAEARRLVVQALALAAGVTLAWFVAAGPLARRLRLPDSAAVAVVIALGGAGAALLTVTGGLARGSGAIRLATVAEAGWGSVVVGLTLIAAALGGLIADAEDAMVARSVTLALGAVVLTARWLGVHGAPRSSAAADARDDSALPSREAGSLWKLSAVMLLAAAATWVTGSLPLWRLSAIGDATARAQFAAVVRMAQLAALPATVVLTMSSPALAVRGRGHLHQDLPELRRRVSRATALVAVYGVLTTAATPWILRHVWEIPSQRAAAIAGVLFAGHLVHCATGPCGYALIMADRERSALGGTVIGGLVALAITFAPTGMNPALHASIVVTVGVVVTNAVNLWQCHRYLGLRTWFTPRAFAR